MTEAVYHRPTTMAEAVRLASLAGGDTLFVGGGTDLQTYRKQQLEQRGHHIDLSGIRELQEIAVIHDQLVMGAMCTLDQLIRSQVVRAWAPLLVEAASQVASPTIRHTATVAGNLLVSNRCTFYNQSPSWRESAESCLRGTGPTCLATGGKDKCFARNVSDMAPALIVLKGRIDLMDQRGESEMPISDLYVADGLRAQGGLPAGALITTLRVSHRPVRWYYRKLRHRDSNDFTSLTVAGALLDDGTTHACLTGASAAPVLLSIEPGSTALADVQSQARQACKAVDNDLVPLKYRRRMIDIYLEELWQAITCGPTSP